MPENKNDIDFGIWTLRRAANKNRSDIARALIEHGADVDEMDPNGWTPLYGAVWNKCSGVARLLIVKGANTDGIDLIWIDDQVISFVD